MNQGQKSSGKNTEGAEEQGVVVDLNLLYYKLVRDSKTINKN